MLTKNELKTIWHEHGFRPLKRYGQNFLIDKNIKNKILRLIKIGREDTVLEIGSGFGEMTVDLASRAKKVIAVEKDKKIVAILKNTCALPSNVVLHEGDFLDLDIRHVAAGRKLIVYGNLPYYATSPIIEKLFRNIECISAMYFLVQKEVADRMLARPGSKEIGRLSLYVQYYAEPKRLIKIGKAAFYPAPKVESTFLKLEVLKERKVRVRNEILFFKAIKSAYGQRRKTILNSLQDVGLGKKELLELLNNANVNPTARAEALSIEDFARISNNIPTLLAL